MKQIMAGWLMLSSAIVGMTGCTSKEAPQKPLPVPIVTMANPVTGEITRYEYFTGRAEPKDQVELRARVSGYLTKIYFTPGTEVKKNDPLFDIDPDPFKAELERAEADFAQADARAQRTGRDLVRMTALRKTNAVSQEDFDKASSDKLEADAAVKASKAKITSAQLNLGYTKILAPLDGKIGDKLVSEGNLVTGGQGSTTLLATIVAVDPIEIGFDIDENTLQRLQKWVRNGDLAETKQGELLVEAGLSVDGDQYPMKGLLDFTDNKVDPKTGTIHLKAEFANPKPKVGGRVLASGMYARVRVPIGKPTKEILVPESALGSDQGVRFLFVIDAENKAIRLNAQVGIQQGTMRVVESVQGVEDKAPRPLGVDERIIVNGLQRVRPGMTVEPKQASK